MQLAQFFQKKAKRIAAIDFGHAVVKIVYVEVLAGEFKLLDYDFKNILPVEEKKEECIIEFINSFIKRQAVPPRDVILSISDSDSVIIKYLALPILPKEEILKAAAWQLKEEIPFDLESALFDWQVVREYADTEGIKKNAIIFIVAKREIVDKYLAVVFKCSLNPISITSGPFNYTSLISYYPPSEQQNLAILDIGYKNAVLCIYNKNKLNFERRLAFSSEKLTQSLTGVLVSAKGKMELSYEQAENIKNTFGIPQEEAQIAQNDVQAIQIISLMRPLLESLIRELKLSFSYCSVNLDMECAAAELYITGGGANLKNLDRYLSQELNINISKLPLPACINIHTADKEKLERDQNQITNTLGAALAGPDVINILPPEIKAQKVELIEKISLRLIAITVGAILLFSLFAAKFQIRDYKNRLKNAQVHLQVIKGIKTFKQKIDLREDLIKRITKGKVPADGFLKLISTLLPQQIILDELFFDQAGHRLFLKGAISARQNIAKDVLIDFVLQLEESSFVSEARLLSDKKVDDVQKFEIACDLVN